MSNAMIGLTIGFAIVVVAVVFRLGQLERRITKLRERVQLLEWRP